MYNLRRTEKNSKMRVFLLLCHSFDMSHGVLLVEMSSKPVISAEIFVAVFKLTAISIILSKSLKSFKYNRIKINHKKVLKAFSVIMWASWFFPDVFVVIITVKVAAKIMGKIISGDICGDWTSDRCCDKLQENSLVYLWWTEFIEVRCLEGHTFTFLDMTDVFVFFVWGGLAVSCLVLIRTSSGSASFVSALRDVCCFVVDWK